MTNFGAALFQGGAAVVRSQAAIRRARSSSRSKAVEFEFTTKAGRELQINATVSVCRDHGTEFYVEDVVVSDPETFEELPEEVLGGEDITDAACEAAQDDDDHDAGEEF